MTICKKEGCCELSSPQNTGDLCLDPQKPDTQEPAFLQKLWALHQSPGSTRLLAQAICPKHVHSHSKDVSAARECCKFLSCGILSTQTAMGYPPARVLNQALSSSSLGESFRCRVWLNWQLGQRSQLLKCKCIQQGGEKKPSRTNPPELYLPDRQVWPERMASSVPSYIKEAQCGLTFLRDK